MAHVDIFRGWQCYCFLDNNKTISRRLTFCSFDVIPMYEMLLFLWQLLLLLLLLFIVICVIFYDVVFKFLCKIDTLWHSSAESQLCVSALDCLSGISFFFFCWCWLGVSSILTFFFSFCLLPLSHSHTQVYLYFHSERTHRKGFIFFIRFHLISSMNSNQASIACDFFLCVRYARLYPYVLYFFDVCACVRVWAIFFYFVHFCSFSLNSNHRETCLFVCLCYKSQWFLFDSGVFTWVIIIWQFAWESKEWSSAH